MAAAVRLAGELSSGLIVVILADSGERYLSTTLFAVPEKKGVALGSVGTASPVYLDPAAGTPGLFTFGPSLSEPGDLDAQDVAVPATNRLTSVGFADIRRFVENSG